MLGDIYNVNYLGKNIKYFRENYLHVTQDKLSESANISVVQLQYIEQGRGMPSVPSLFALANSLKVPIDYLAKDDCKASQVFTISKLIKEISKTDDALLDNLTELLISIKSKL